MENPQLGAIIWSATVTQIECPEKAYFAQFDKRLAPVGCLQYFTEPNGTIESFNYNQGNGPYFGSFDYAICVRRPSLKENLTWVGRISLESALPNEIDLFFFFLICIDWKPFHSNWVKQHRQPTVSIPIVYLMFLPQEAMRIIYPLAMRFVSIAIRCVPANSVVKAWKTARWLSQLQDHSSFSSTAMANTIQRHRPRKDSNSLIRWHRRLLLRGQTSEYICNE